MYKLSAIEKDFDNIITDIGEPKWMREIRKEAFQSYSKLPFEVSQLYRKYSNANYLIPEKVFIDEKNVDRGTEEFNERLEDLNSGPSILCKNSKVIKTFLPEELRKQGVIISDILEAINNFPDLIYNFMIKNKLDCN
ncbi:MAG TPA: hypothetical protein VLE21_06190, partial [Candidatus Nitrosocosmicus sp.]|nr:hypothetical protein [Candidatus Nitrosocosmicus sp.]